MGMNASESPIGEAARLWTIRVQDPAFDDWDGLAAWLEQDPAHLAAYDAALEDDAWAADLFATPPEPAVAEPALVVPLRPSRRNWFALGGVAAAAVAAVAGWVVLDRDAAPLDIVTAPGEHRTVDLADGSRMTLNGGTRVTIDPDTPREIRLAQGEALFQVKHDAAKPFLVMAGETRLLDAGTVFNVVHDGGAMDVAVASGAVIYQPGAQQIRLNPGDGLSRSGPGAEPVLRRANPQAIGSWQTGQLIYDNAGLDQVARDLSRNIGRPVHVKGGAERLRFTGTLVLQGPPEQVLARAGPLLGVAFVTDGQAWTMSPANGARP